MGGKNQARAKCNNKNKKDRVSLTSRFRPKTFSKTGKFFIWNSWINIIDTEKNTANHRRSYLRPTKFEGSLEGRGHGSR